MIRSINDEGCVCEACAQTVHLNLILVKNRILKFVKRTFIWVIWILKFKCNWISKFGSQIRKTEFWWFTGGGRGRSRLTTKDQSWRKISQRKITWVAHILFREWRINSEIHWRDRRDLTPGAQCSEIDIFDRSVRRTWCFGICLYGPFSSLDLE